MKLSIVFIYILAGVVCIYGHSRAEIKQMVEDCRVENGLKEIPAGSPNKHMTDPKEKCFHACLMEKEGLMINGKFDLEKIIKWKPEGRTHDHEQHRDVLKSCVELANQENDKCEAAAKLVKCALEKLEQAGDNYH